MRRQHDFGAVRGAGNWTCVVLPGCDFEADDPGVAVGEAFTATAPCFAEREHPLRHNFPESVPI
jgi:hypothetical protein